MKASNRHSRVGNRSLPWTLDLAVETLGTIGDQSSFSCSICSIYSDVVGIERWGSCGGGGTEKVLKVWWICRSAGLWTSSRIANSENISTGDTMACQVEKPWDYLKVRDWLHGVGVMSRTTGPRIQGTP